MGGSQSHVKSIVHLIQVGQLFDLTHARVGPQKALQERDAGDASTVSFEA